MRGLARLVGAFVALSLLVPVPAAGLDTSVTVSNAAPVVVSVTLPGSTVSPTAGGLTTVEATIVVEDLNGHNDLHSVTLQVLKPDGSTTHVAAAGATLSSASGVQATYLKSFAMAFYDDPALGADTYKVKVVVEDAHGAQGDNLASLAAFHYAELTALSLGSSALDLGSELQPDTTSQVATLAVQNAGNVPIDVQLSGTALSHATEAASIAASRLAYSTASNMSEPSSLSTSPSTLGTFDLAKGPSSSQSLYWQLAVPSGADQWVPSGAYTGLLTVGAVKG